MFSVWIDGVEYPVLRGSISIDKRVEERSVANFTIVDEAGVYNFTRGMPVQILQPWALPPFHLNEFSGYIDTPGRGKQWVGAGLLHDISCMDNHYLADKRLVVKVYTGQTAGSIAFDLWESYLESEGVEIAYHTNWLTPTSHDDPAVAWTNEVNAYDSNIATLSYSSLARGAGYVGNYLVLNHAEILCDKVRIWSAITTGTAKFIQLDVYYNSSWHTIYDGALIENTWVEYDIGSRENITAMRAQFHYTGGSIGGQARIYETSFSEFVPDSIQAGPTIAEVIFNYVKASQCLDALQELTGFTWFIDETKQLFFIDRETNLSPWNLDGTTHRAIKDSVHLSTGNPMYRNKQYVRGGTGLTLQQTENFTGDGVNVAFTVGYPIAQKPEIWVNAVQVAPALVGIKGIDTGMTCYWNKGDATITFDIAPGAVGVEIVYYGQYPLISLAVSGDIANQASIEGTSGIVEEITVEVQHESSDSINESAQGKIKQYCQDAERFTYQTYEFGLSPGQLQEITYTPFGFAAHKMLIESITILTNGEDVRYNITCITGPSIGSWARFFSGILKRQDASIKIGDSLLLVLLQQSEILELSEVGTLDEDEFAVSGNVNRWLNSAPIDFGSLYNIQHERLEMTEVGSEAHHTTEDYLWDDGCLWGFATWA